jgi:hypothetical protein
LPLALLPALTHAAWLGNILFAEPDGTVMPHGQRIDMSIDYKITHPDGARIYVEAYSGGEPVPTQAVSPSPVFPAGALGTYNDAFFTVESDDYVVDEVRVYMMDADLTEELLEILVATDFTFGATGVYDISFSEGPYSHLTPGQQLVIDFAYETTEAAGVRVFARPWADGAPLSGYSASPSSLLPPSGTGEQRFSFPTPDVDMTDVHFRVTNGDQSEELLVFDVPLPLYWRDVRITNILFDVTSPASLFLDEPVTVFFDYFNATGDDVLIWWQAFTGGDYTPGGIYEASPPVPPGGGSLSRFFRVESFESEADAARLIVMDAAQTVAFIDTEIPGTYHWGPNAIKEVVLYPPPPAILDSDEALEVYWDYETDETAGVYIDVTPMHQGEPAPGYVTTDSPLYPVGAGIANRDIGFPNATQAVDQVRFQVFDAARANVLFTWFVNTEHYFGATNDPTPVADALPRAAALGQNYPNPFNPATTIPIDLPREGHVRVSAYDLRGRLVSVLADETMVAGAHALNFDGSDLPSGTYFYRLVGAGVSETRRMTLAK